MSRSRRAEPRMPRARRLATLALAAGAAGAAACGRTMPLLDDAGEGAARISALGDFMLLLSAVVFAGVLVVLAWAVARNRRRPDEGPDLAEPGTKWVIFGGFVMPVVVLSAIFVVGMTTMAMLPPRPREPALTVNVTGHQWWWEIEYAGPEMQTHVVTANELHIPRGQPVRLVLTSGDVIHSFWLPQLAGKMDLIPGDTNELLVTARADGRYRGQCAEYCGMQHANMGITAIVESPDAFRDWWRAQLEPSRQPADSLAALGERLFMGGPCALCHTVRGTPANGKVAPDLTHVGSRTTLAAGTVPNGFGNLEAWIVDAQSLKPGALMPSLPQFDGRELRALTTYVWGLK